jgi:predicted RNase H-like HicB family nuclease
VVLHRHPRQPSPVQTSGQEGTAHRSRHPGDDIYPGTLKSILVHAGLKGKLRKYAIIIEHGENNLSAYVPDLPGCIATGRTVEEIERKIREAIEFHLEGLRRDGEPIPEPQTRQPGHGSRESLGPKATARHGATQSGTTMFLFGKRLLYRLR